MRTPKTVAPAEIEDAFIKVNPGLSTSAISVTCDRKRLSEVRICMSKDLQFRACEETDRRACRRDEVVMPPMRGGVRCATLLDVKRAQRSHPSSGQCTSLDPLHRVRNDGGFRCRNPSPMNYRHAFHAGGFADVIKHIVLVRMLAYLQEKPAAFRVIDTHAGAGVYDLTSEEARRGGEWLTGIARSCRRGLRNRPSR